MERFEISFREKGQTPDGGAVVMWNTQPDGGKIASGEAALIEQGEGKNQRIIYAAVPEWTGGERGEMEALSSCCHAALRLTEEWGIQTVNFSSAPEKYPISQAATVMERAIMSSLQESPGITRVRILCDSNSEEKVYRMTYNLWYAERKSDRL